MKYKNKNKSDLQDYQQILVILVLDLRIKGFYLLKHQPFVAHPNMYQPR
jgi:hypothetical protein